MLRFSSAWGLTTSSRALFRFKLNWMFDKFDTHAREKVGCSVRFVIRLRKMATEEVRELIDGLKELNAKGISQAQIARMLGVTRQRVHSWFKSGVTPEFDVGIKIQQLLKGRK